MSSLLRQPQLMNRLCAWMLLGFSALALLWSLLQLALAMTMNHYGLQQRLVDNGLFAEGLLGWALSHATAISVWQLLSCLPCIAVAFGMLRLHHWGRTGCIMLLLLSIPLNLGFLVLFDRLLVDALMPMLTSREQGRETSRAMGMLLQSRIALWLSAGLPTLVLCTIHGWLAWRFSRPDMRGLYQR